MILFDIYLCSSQRICANCAIIGCEQTYHSKGQSIGASPVNWKSHLVLPVVKRPRSFLGGKGPWFVREFRFGRVRVDRKVQHNRTISNRLMIYTWANPDQSEITDYCTQNCLTGKHFKSCLNDKNTHQRNGPLNQLKRPLDVIYIAYLGE